MTRLRTRATDFRSEAIDIQQTPELTRTTATDDQEEAISKRAYELWLLRGCPEGSPEEDWYQAESEMRRRGQGAGGGAGSA